MTKNRPPIITTTLENSRQNSLEKFELAHVNNKAKGISRHQQRSKIKYRQKTGTGKVGTSPQCSTGEAETPLTTMGEEQVPLQKKKGDDQIPLEGKYNERNPSLNKSREYQILPNKKQRDGLKYSRNHFRRLAHSEKADCLSFFTIKELQSPPYVRYKSVAYPSYHLCP